MYYIKCCVFYVVYRSCTYLQDVYIGKVLLVKYTYALYTRYSITMFLLPCWYIVCVGPNKCRLIVFLCASPGERVQHIHDEQTPGTWLVYCNAYSMCRYKFRQQYDVFYQYIIYVHEIFDLYTLHTLIELRKPTYTEMYLASATVYATDIGSYKNVLCSVYVLCKCIDRSGCALVPFLQTVGRVPLQNRAKQ